MSYIYIVLFIFSITSTVILFQEDIFEGLVSLFIASLFLSLMFNIHGVDIDLNKKIIITYKKVLWFRIDKRFDITDFKTLNITQDKVLVRTTEYSDHRSDTYYYYYLNLVCSKRNLTVLLAESEDYRAIASAAEAISLELHMEIYDEVFASN